VDAGAGARTGADAGAGADAASADGGASAIDAAACVVCDDFERGVVGVPPGGAWTVSSPNCSGTGSLAIDGTVAHSGSKSVKVSGAAGYCNHVFFATSITAARPVTWLRFYVRLDTALGDGHTTFLAMRDAHDAKDLRMGGQNRVLMYNRESDDATLPEMSPAGAAKSIAPNAGAWTCVESAIDQGNKTIRTWVDGVAIEGLADDGVPTTDVDAAWLRDTAWTPDLVDVRFGWESYGSQAETLWFDDVAIGTERLGCLPTR
jgi:hypothetical protein